MSIWHAPVEIADRVNKFAYAAVVGGTLLGLVATVFMQGDRAIGAAILAATLAAIGTFAIFWASAVRANHSDRTIAEARAAAAAAHARAATLERGMAWRQLSEEQVAGLVSALKGQTFPIWVTGVSADPEAATLHQQIYEVLKAAGLDAHWFSGYARAVGLTISDHAVPERDFN